MEHIIKDVVHRDFQGILLDMIVYTKSILGTARRYYYILLLINVPISDATKLINPEPETLPPPEMVLLRRITGASAADS